MSKIVLGITFSLKMSDYSNLLRGGGLSSANSPRKNKGKNKIFAFVVLCCLVILSIWIYGKFNGNDQIDKGNDSINPDNKTGTETPITVVKNTKNGSEKPLTPKVHEKSSIPVKELKEANDNLAKAAQALQKDEFVTAKKYAQMVMNCGLKEGDKLWEQAAEILGKANTGIYMTDIPAPNKKLYTIQEGDSLIKIAKRFKTTVEAIQKSNGLEPSNPIIFPGRTLYIYTGEWSVKVKKDQFKLYLYDGNSIFKIYKIGIGRQGRTPSGTFIISTKQKEPIWYNEGKAIPYGSKENVLGTRWMALKAVGDTNSNLRGYGIHGTWEPDTIGTQASNGCIRMKNEDVNELYSILPYRTEVTILE